MRSWTNIKVRRLMLAGAVALTVGLPILACGGGADRADPVKETIVEEDDGLDPEQAIVGVWMIQPEATQLRELKIIDFAVNRPDTKLGQLKKRLKPPPTEAEIKTYNELRAADPNSPEIDFAKMYLDMLKSARLEITSSKWALDLAGEQDSWTYTVQGKTADSLTVKLEDGSVNKLVFKDEDHVDVQLTQGGQTLDLGFKRE
jgi:hypothetical protein